MNNEERAESLDKEISKITKSTRATVPVMTPLHDILRQKYPWYYRWHLNPLSKVIHTLILGLWIILVTGVVVYGNVYQAPTVKAAADYTCTFDGSASANWNDPANWDDDAACNGEYPGQAAHSYDVVVPTGKSVTLNVNSLDLTNGGTAGGNVSLTGTMNTNGNDITMLSVTVNTNGALTATASETLTSKGNWAASAGTFTRATSTVKLTESGTVSSKYDSAFYNLWVAYTGKATTLSTNVLIRGKLTLNGDSTGTVTGGYTNFQFYSSVPNPSDFIASNGATMVGQTGITVYGSNTVTMVLPAGEFYNTIELLGNAAGALSNFELGGNIKIRGVLYAYGGSASRPAKLDLKGYNLQTRTDSTWLGRIDIGLSGDTTRYGQIVNSSQTTDSTIALDNNLTIYAGGGNSKIDASGSGGSPHTININIKGNWANSDTFTAGTSTVDFNGTGTQTLNTNGTSNPFNNFNHSGASTLQLVTSDIDINSTFTNSAGTFDADTNDKNMVFGGAWNNTGSATFSRGSGTMTFDGTSTVTNSSSAAASLGAITITGTATLGSSLTMISNTGAGILNLGAGSYTLTLSGTGSPMGVTTFQKGTGSTVVYTGTTTATNIGAVQYNHLTLTPSGATTYSLANHLNAANSRNMTGNLTINANATLTTTASNYNLDTVDVTINTSGTLTPNASTLTVSGNWTNSGTMTKSGNTSTVAFTGATPNINAGGNSDAKSFYNINTVSNQTVTLASQSRVYGTWTAGTTSGATYTTLTGTSQLQYLRGTTNPLVLNGTRNASGGNGGFNLDNFSPAFNTTGSINIPGATYYTVYVYLGAGTNTATLTGDTTFNTLYMYSENSSGTVILSTGNYALNVTTGVSIGTGSASRSATLSLGSSTVTVGGSVTINASDAVGVNTLDAGSANLLIGGDYTNNDVLTAGSSTVNFNKTGGTQTLNSGGTGVAKAFSSLTHSGTSTLQQSTNNIDIDANFINSAGTFNTGGLDMSVGGNVNLTTGSFTQGTRTITLDGAGAQSFTAGGTGAGHTPYNITVTNASASGVTFADSLTLATGGTLADNTAGSKLTFTSGATYTIPTLDIDGGVGSLVTMVSSSGGSTYALNVTNAPTLTYVDSKDSNAGGGAVITANNSNDSGNNTNWNFGGGVTYISGTVYTAENKSTNLGAGKTIALSVNGAAKNTTTTGDGGVFSFNSVGVAANNTLTFSVDSATAGEQGTLVTQVLNTTNDITGLEMYTGDIALRHETAGPMTNTLLDTADNCPDCSYMNFSVSGGNATFTKKLWVESGFTYTPGGQVTTTSFELRGTGSFIPAANAVAVSGNWIRSVTGTFTTSGAVTFNGSTAQTITNPNTWYDLIISNTYGSPSDTYDVDPDSAQTVTGTLTINDGQWSVNTGDSYNDVAINYTTDTVRGTMKPDAGASYTVAGNFSLASGASYTYSTATTTFTGSGKSLLGTAAVLNFYNMIINTGASLAVGGSLTSVTVYGTNLTVNGSLTLGASDTVTINNTAVTLNIGAAGTIEGTDVATSKLVLSGDATPTITMANSETGNFGPNLNLQFYLYSGNYTLPSLHYKAGKVELYGDFIFDNSTHTVTPEAGTLDVDGELALRVRNLISGTPTLDLNNSNNTAINIGGNFSRSETSGIAKYTKGTTDTITFDKSSSTQTFDPGSTSNFNNIVHSAAGTLQLDNTNLSLSGNLDLTSGNMTTLDPDGINSRNITTTGNVTIGAGATLTANSSTVSVGGNWSNADTFTAGSSTVDFTKSSDTQTLTSGGTGTGKAFNNLTHSGAGTLQLSTNAIDIDGNFANSAGTFDANGLNVNVAKNWNISGGSFSAGATPGTQTVTLDSTNESVVSGSTTFNNLTMNTSVDGAKTITFTAGTTQTISAGKTWTLNGASGKVLTLQSSVPTSAWYFAIPADMNSGDYLNVRDSQNITNAFRITPGSNVTDSGNNNPGWLFAPTNAPTIGAPTAASTTSIRWNFTDTNPNEVGFKVYDATDVLKATCVGADLTYCDETGLSVNTQYAGRYVVAYNDSGASPHSGTAASIYTLANAPAAPTVTINSWEAANGNSLTVVTDANSNPATTEFALSCNNTPDSWLQNDGSCGAGKVWKTKANWETGTTNYLINLTADTDYTLLVRARNGDSVETADSPTNGPNKTAPAQVQNLTHSTNTTSSVTWSWDANVVAPDGYNVYEYTLGACSATQKATAAGTSVAEGSLSANTQYSRCSRAYRGAVLGQPTANTAVYTSIETPTGITFGTIATNTIDISASGTLSNLSAGTSGLYFTETTGSGGGAACVGSWTQTNACTDTGLSVNSQYGYTVKARNGDGDETGETAVSNKYTLANVPSAPTASQASSTSLTVAINVNANPAATEFAIYNQTLNKYIQANGSSDSSAVWQNYAAWGGASGVTNTGLTHSTTYAYQVKARNGDNTETALSDSASVATLSQGSGTKTPSPTASVSPTASASASASPSATATPTSEVSSSPTAVSDVQAPTVPSNLRATALGAITLTLTWDAATDDAAVKGYEIYNSATGILVGTTANTYFNFTGLSPSSTYTFYVRSFDNSSHYSPNSSVLTITTLGSRTPEEQTIEQQGGVVAFLIMNNVPKSVNVGQNLPALKVTAADAGGNVAKGYGKSIHFTSTDSQAKIAYTEAHPYTFQTSDNGVHTFLPTDFVFKTAGNQQLTVSDYSTKSTVTLEVKSTGAAVIEQSAVVIAGFFNNPTQVANANMVLGALIALALVMPTLVNAFSSISSWWAELLYAFTLIGQSLGFKKRRRKTWGVVFNSQTGQPIPYAFVKLVDKDNRLIEMAISDRQGKYAFSSRIGTFILKVDRADFIYPSSKNSSNYYEKLYTGDIFKLTQDQQSMTYNIALDPHAKSVFGMKLWTVLIRFNHLIQRLRLPLLILGACFAIVMLVIGFNLVYVVFLGFCLVVIILDLLVNYKKVIASGTVSNIYSRPIVGAIVRIYHRDDNHLIATDISSNKGNFRFKVDPGVYYLVATKPQHIDTKTHFMYLEKTKKKGVITSINIELKKGA